LSKMFPGILPATVRDDPGRRAEVRVFDSLQAQLSDEFLVFYGVAWLNKGRRGTFEDGEADFVVAHSEYGILVIEVKGGGIEVDRHSG
jgi:Nuclease-related domain